MSRKRTQLEFGQKLAIAERLAKHEDPHKLAEEFGCSIQSVWKARKEEAKNRAIVRKWGGDGHALKMTRQPTHMWVLASEPPIPGWTVAPPKKRKVPAPAKQQAAKNTPRAKPSVPAPAPAAAPPTAAAAAAAGPNNRVDKKKSPTKTTGEERAAASNGLGKGKGGGQSEELAASFLKIVEWSGKQPPDVQKAAEMIYAVYRSQQK